MYMHAHSNLIDIKCIMKRWTRSWWVGDDKFFFVCMHSYMGIHKKIMLHADSGINKAAEALTTTVKRIWRSLLTFLELTVSLALFSRSLLVPLSWCLFGRCKLIRFRPSARIGKCTFKFNGCLHVLYAFQWLSWWWDINYDARHVFIIRSPTRLLPIYGFDILHNFNTKD